MLQTQPMQSQRLHALDNLRAIMMWLGIVLHVAVIHIVGRSMIPWRDPETTRSADFMVAFIHAFRMPVFFILAGFFVALLVQRRGYAGMFKHRLRRIGLPLLVFWLPIFFGTMALAAAYLHLMAPEVSGMTLRALAEDVGVAMPASGERPPIGTLHLWFIYYLLWFCGMAALCGLAGKLLPARFKTVIEIAGARAGEILASSWWGFLMLTLPLAAVGSFYWNGIVVPDGAFMLRWTEVIHNGMFFLFGWILYQHQERLLPLYAKHCWRALLVGLCFFMVSLPLFDTLVKNPGQSRYLPGLIAFAFHGASWLWSFALIGLFIRYLPAKNRFLAYVADSSYWVYLVHFPATVGFGLLLYDAPFGALTKIGINIAATTITCIVSYHLLVRYTPLGTLLNGRMHALPFRVRTIAAAGIVVLICGFAITQIRFSQVDTPTRSGPPAAIAVPTDIDQFLRDVGRAYGSAASADIGNYLATDFLHQGMDRAAFLDHVKKQQRYLGQLTITPVSFKQDGDQALLTAYASSARGVIAPSLQLLPLHIGGALIKQDGSWKLRGNQQYTEAGLYQDVSTIVADFAPTDLDAYRRFLPAGYGMPPQPYVRISVSNWHQMAAPQLPYRLAQLSILASKDGENIWYVIALPETDWLAVEAGKAIGFPKFVSDIDIDRSIGNQWQVALRHQNRPLIEIAFDGVITTKTSSYLKDWPNNGNDWLIFGQDGAGIRAAMHPLTPARRLKTGWGWMTVTPHAGPWQALLAPGSRALGLSIDATGPSKLHLLPLTDTRVPDDIRRLLDQTAAAWANQDMDQVMAQHHPAFKVTNQRDLVEMRRLFPMTRRYEWRVKGLREEGKFAYLTAEVQTEAGVFPASRRLIRQDGRWYFYGDGGSWDDRQNTMPATGTGAAPDRFDAYMQQQAQQVLAANDDLQFESAPQEELNSFTSLRNAIFKPKGPGPHPALVMLHGCGGIYQRSARQWIEAALEQGYLVMTVDSLREHVRNCSLTPKVSYSRRVKDAYDALAHLSKLPMVDPRRIAVAGFSQGGTIALLAASSKMSSPYSSGKRFAAGVALYPLCFVSKRHTEMDFDYLRPDIDQPLLVLMGEEDTLTPSYDCIPNLQQLAQRGAPVQWHAYPRAGHGWDMIGASGASLVDYKGDRMVFSYDAETTRDSRQRLFDFLNKSMARQDQH